MEKRNVGERRQSCFRNLNLHLAKEIKMKTLKEFVEEACVAFIEKGAELEHTRWAKWQSYLHSKCIENADGSQTIPAPLVLYWNRQIGTHYDHLSEEEKKSDRKESRSYVPLLKEKLLQSATLTAEAVKCEERLLEPYENEEERNVMISIFGDAKTPEYWKERMFGWNQSVTEIENKKKAWFDTKI